MFLKPHSYSNRLKSGEDIRKVVPDFVNDLMTSYERIASRDIAKFFFEADRIGRSIAWNSDGIEDYYKLSPNWVQILLAQLALFAAKETGGEDEHKRIADAFRSLCNSYGWDAEDAIEPKPDATRTVMKFVYTSENTEIVFNIILVSCLKYPIGQRLVSRKNEIYTVNIPAKNSNMLECEQTGRLIPFTDYMLRNFSTVG